MLQVKRGANTKGVQINMIEAVKVLASIATALGFNLVITSGVDSLYLHGNGNLLNTLHDDGLALDLRIKNIPDVKTLEIFLKIARELYPMYDFVLEKTHIHMEYDPKFRKVN